MIDSLGKNTSSFLKHYWNSKNKPIGEKEIYRVLKKTLKNRLKSFHFYQTYIKNQKSIIN